MEFQQTTTNNNKKILTPQALPLFQSVVSIVSAFFFLSFSQFVSLFSFRIITFSVKLRCVIRVYISACSICAIEITC